MIEKEEIKFSDSSEVALIKSNGTDIDVARAAWVSLDPDPREKDSDRVAGLINFLWSEGHTSPFEHGSMTFYVKTPIFVQREFMRHRTQSYNEWSGRYSEMIPEFYLPNTYRPLVQKGKVGRYHFELGSELQHATVEFAVRDACTLAWHNYRLMKEQGIANEVARIILPLNTYTRFYATVNPLNLMKFLRLRSDAFNGQALWEIREVANQILTHFEAEMPITGKVFRDSFNEWQEFLEWKRNASSS